MSSQDTHKRIPIPARVIIARMETLCNTYRIPQVKNDGGEILVTYQWTSDVMEAEYNQLVQALAIATQPKQ